MPRRILENTTAVIAGGRVGARKATGDVASKLAEVTDDALFGDVWERPQLSKRDRSLITCAALVALGATEVTDEQYGGSCQK